MPHLRFRGIEEEKIVDISTELLDKLEKAIDCPRDYFTVEHISSKYIFDGVRNAGKWPFVEVLWFDRGNEIMKEVASIITEIIQRDIKTDVTVYFTNLNKEHYFENGEHF